MCAACVLSHVCCMCAVICMLYMCVLCAGVCVWGGGRAHVCVGEGACVVGAY